MTEVFNSDVCELKHRLVDKEIEAIKEEQCGIRDDIREVRNLQKQILYAIISLFGTSILILVGVVFGRVIDFGLLMP